MYVASPTPAAITTNSQLSGSGTAVTPRSSDSEASVSPDDPPLPPIKLPGTLAMVGGRSAVNVVLSPEVAKVASGELDALDAGAANCTEVAGPAGDNTATASAAGRPRLFDECRVNVPPAPMTNDDCWMESTVTLPPFATTVLPVPVMAPNC